jgi:uncharacterized protein YndB with AHSA1/START domain
MTVTADVAGGAIHGVIEMAAPPEEVFTALTDPAQLAAWWGSDETYRSYDWQVDLRVGGRWSSRQRSRRDPAAPETSVHGEYLVVEPPRLLVCTWCPSWEGFAETTIRYELEPATVNGTTGTRLTITHSGFGDRAAAIDGHHRGWTTVLGWLATHVERKAGRVSATSETRSRPLLRSAAVVLVLYAAGHTFGGMLHDTGRGRGQAALFAAMRAFTFPVQGVTRSYWDFYRGFGFFCSLSLVLLAAFAWLLGTLSRTHPLAARPLVVALGVGLAAMTALTWVDFFPAPGMFSTVATLLVAWAALSLPGEGV